jgi:hypothetical protein
MPFWPSPYLFYTESVLHCYLHHVLWSLSLGRGFRVKVDGRTVESVLPQGVNELEKTVQVWSRT